MKLDFGLAAHTRFFAMGRGRQGPSVFISASCWARKLAVFVIALVMFVSVRAEPVERRLNEDGVVFELVGHATFRWKRVVGVYDASLHVGSGADPMRILRDDMPLRLDIRYRRAFAAVDIIKGGDALLARNVSAETLMSLRSRLEELNRAYRDVKTGDRYTLTYAPGAGTTLRLNAVPLITVPGEDFARAYFSIWLGPDPIGLHFRDQLLGRS